MDTYCAVSAFILAAFPLQAQDLADIFAKVSPSVVTIHTTEVRVTGEQSPRMQAQAKTGSGVLIDATGTILTAAHVVDFADEVEIEFIGGNRQKATVSVVEPGADLALVRVVGDLPAGIGPCVLGDSSAVRIGNEVFAVGAPLGMGHTLTAGHVSARRRDEVYMGGMRFVEHLQTDAAINPGNSGGPLFDLRGEVVGIVCHISTSAFGSEGIGFAVTSNAVRELLLDRRPPWLGFDAMLLPEPLARALNVPDGRTGLLVLRVARSSPAHRAGLRAGTIPVQIGAREIVLGGDIVLVVQGRPLTTAAETVEAMQALRGLKAGDTLRLSALREGKIVELEAKIGGS